MSGSNTPTCISDMNFLISSEESFHKKYTMTDSCWIFNSIFSNGYGCFRFKNKSYRAHRIMWVLKNGKIPYGMYVLHKCDVKNCVNPDHLFLGTAQDNIDDCISKGRFIVASGSNHGTKTKPHRIARGLRHGSRTHPEQFRNRSKRG